jgi:HAD superfamily hydrolase (TIGR01509 family)
LIKGVIFDLDGIMIDSEPLAFQAWQLCLRPYGARLTWEQNRHLIGLDHEASLSYIIKLTGLTAVYETLNKGFWPQLLTLIEDIALTPLPGLLPLLDELDERKCLMGIGSNSPSSYVQKITTKLGIKERFTCMVGADQVAEGKPAPDVYLEVARCLRLAPASCLVLEDSPTGTRAALSAGMHCVLISNTEVDVSEIEGASAIFPSLIEFHSVLDEVLFNSSHFEDRPI